MLHKKIGDTRRASRYFNIDEEVIIKEKKGKLRTRWRGKIIAMRGHSLTLKDITPGSKFYGETFHRHLEDVRKIVSI